MWKINLKLNKKKCYLRCSSMPFFGEIVSIKGVRTDPRELQALTEMPQYKNNLQSFVGIVDQLSNFLSMKSEVCEQLQYLTSVKVEWTWN